MSSPQEVRGKESQLVEQANLMTSEDKSEKDMTAGRISWKIGGIGLMVLSISLFGSAIDEKIKNNLEDTAYCIFMIQGLAGYAGGIALYYLADKIFRTEKGSKTSF